MDQTDNDSGNEMTNMQIRVKRRANRVKRKSKKQNAKSNLNATASAFSPFTPKTSQSCVIMNSLQTRFHWKPHSFVLELSINMTK